MSRVPPPTPPIPPNPGRDPRNQNGANGGNSGGNSGSRDARIADRLELLVESYLLGELRGDELAGFERDLARSHELRRQVDTQRQIEASLRRLYVAPEAVSPEVIAEEWPTLAQKSLHRRRPWHQRRLTWLAAAATLLLGIGIWSWIPRETVTRLAPDELYTIMRGRGFRPEFVCTTDEAFAKLIKDRFGQGLVPTHAVGVEMLGWGYTSDYYGSPLSTNALVLLATSEGEPVVVIMDRLSEDRTLKMPAGRPPIRPPSPTQTTPSPAPSPAPTTPSPTPDPSPTNPQGSPTSPDAPTPAVPSSAFRARCKLHLYRRVLGDLVLYEITPRPGPEVIESLRIAE
jgi:hypothetical protein